MHIYKLDVREYGNRMIMKCPYCNIDQWANPGLDSYLHDCPDAGKTWIINGHMFVEVPQYIFSEEQSTTKHN